jgi:type I restriction enzyme S subunit
MKFGLTDEQICQIQEILANYPAISGAVVFGSRAMGNYKEASDVDIALKGDVTSSMVADVKYALDEETYLPFFFDVIAYGIIDNDKLKQHIDKYGVSLYRAGWKECRLGDVVVFQRGHDLPKTEMNTGAIPVAGSNGIIGYHNKSTTKGPGLTIGRSGNIGTPKFYQDDFWAHNTVLYVKDFKGNDEKYIFYFLQTFDFEGFNAGSAVPTLNRNHIHEIPVVIPPLPEQRAIAGVLSSLDDKIDLLYRQNKTLEGMAEALWRKMFVEEADPGWKVGVLSDYIEIIDNRGKTPPFIETKTNYPIIEVNALTGMERLVNYAVVKKYVTEQTYNTWFRAGHPKINDILISTVGSIGEISMFLIDKGSIAQNVVALRATNTSPFYLYQYLKHFQNDMKEYDIGSVQPSIKVTHLVKMKFFQPSLEKLGAFDIAMYAILDKLVVNYKQIQTASSLRDTLLPKLMSGEVTVHL